MSYKQAFIECCSVETNDARALMRQSKLLRVMTPQEAKIVDEAVVKMVADIAGIIGGTVDDLASHLQINGALYALRMAVVNLDSMEDFFNQEAILATVLNGGRVETTNGVTPGCDCPVCSAVRAQEELDRQRGRPN